MASNTTSLSNNIVNAKIKYCLSYNKLCLRPFNQRTRQGLLFVLLFLLPTFASAQEPPEAAYPYRRDIEKFKFDRAEQKLFKHLKRDTNNLELNYAAYHLYSIPSFPRYNTDSAYHHLVTARRIYDAADQKMIERWTRDSYSGALFDYSFRRLSSMALSDAHTRNTPDAYRHFLDYYVMAPDDIRDSAVRFRDTIEYDIALRAGTLQMLEDFITRRPQSVLTPHAIHLRDSIVFDGVNKKHTVAAYIQFCKDYPNSHLLAPATDSLYLLDYRNTLHYDAEQYYRAYAERYPLSPYAQQAVWHADSIEYHRACDTSQWITLVHFADLHHRNSWRDTALHALARYAIQHKHVEAANQAVNRLAPGSNDHAQMAVLLHDAYLHTSIRNFHKFYQRYPNIISSHTRHNDSLAFVLNNNYDYNHADSCIRAIAPSHEAYMMLQQILKDDIDHGRFSAASTTAKSYAAAFRYNYEYIQLLNTLSTDFTSIKELTSEIISKSPQPLRGLVNSPKGDEYAPVLTGDGRTLFFAAKNRPENFGGEDVFVAHLTKKGWSEPQIEIDLSHTYGNEAPVSVSPDGNTVLLYQSGTLYRADRTAEGWDVAPLPATINGSRWQADASLAANGRVLFFAAMGRTDREVDSSLNIYVSLMDSNGNWGQPFEIGPAINTPFDERSPYLHPDMRTLYFSSESHGSLGQMDVFMSTRLDDSFTRWSTPINIGREVNTTGDDWGYKISTDGKLCYFSRRNTSQDIYTVQLPLGVRPQPVVPVSGTVKDHSGKPIATQLLCHDPITGQLLGQYTSHPTKGTFYILLPRGQEYVLTINNAHYRAEKQVIDLTPSAPDDKSPVKLTITATPIPIDESTAPEF